MKEHELLSNFSNGIAYCKLDICIKGKGKISQYQQNQKIMSLFAHRTEFFNEIPIQQSVFPVSTQVLLIIFLCIQDSELVNGREMI